MWPLPKSRAGDLGVDKVMTGKTQSSSRLESSQGVTQGSPERAAEGGGGNSRVIPTRRGGTIRLLRVEARDRKVRQLHNRLKARRVGFSLAGGELDARVGLCAELGVEGGKIEAQSCWMENSRVVE